MTKALLSAALTLPLFAALAVAGGPKEQSGPALGGAGIPQVVAPVTLPQGNLVVPAANMALPSAALPSGAAVAPAALPSSAVAPPQAASAAAAPAQAAAAPPAGPPNGPNTAAAPPSGPPPGGPGRGPDEGPVPGPAGQDGQATGGERRAALSQLKAELASLEKEQRRLSTTAARIAVGQKDAPGVEAMKTAEAARQQADALTPRIQAKRAELSAANREQKAHYDALRDEVAQLKREEDQALAQARSAGALGHEFKGGAAEARARALERWAALHDEINARKRDIALIERDNPRLAGLRAPLVAAKNALGLAPRTAAETRLRGEIAELDLAADEKEERARSLFKTETEHPGIGAAEEGFKWLQVAKKDRAAAAKKRAELAAVQSGPAARAPTGEEIRLSGDIARLDAEQKRLDATALRILVGQKDSPSPSAVEAAHAAQSRARELRSELERKRQRLREARPR